MRKNNSIMNEKHKKTNTYHSSKTQFLNELYRPMMNDVVEISWVSAYFKLEAIEALFEEVDMTSFQTRIKIIVSTQLDQNTVEKLKLSYEYKSRLEQELMNAGCLEEKEEIRNSYIKILKSDVIHFLILKDLLHIKVAYSKKRRLFHSKYGVIKSASLGKVGFIGSNNLTLSGMNWNYESLHWIVSSQGLWNKEQVEELDNEFNMFWQDKQNTDFEIVDFTKFDWLKNYKLREEEKRMEGMTELAEIPDALILTISEDNHLYMIDNLIEDKKITSSDMVIRRLNNYFEEFPQFKKNLSYLQMQRIIERFEKRAKRKGFIVIVSDKLQAFLAKQAYYIEERSRYGLIIKENHLEVDEKFNKFKDIVDSILVRKLRPQQMWSAFYMTEMVKSANFSVPGSGKTSMVYGAYAYLNAIKSEDGPVIERIVMVGPKSSFISWKDEFVANFGEGKLKVLDIHEEKKPDLVIEMYGKQRNLILVNYEALPKLESSLSRLIDDKTLLVFDEVHKIKGVDSIRPKHALEIAKNAKYKIVLTGTPIPNSYSDIYNFLNLLYTDEYNTFFNYSQRTLKEPTLSEEKSINEKLRPFFWRTTKKQLGVPKPNEDKILSIPANKVEKEMIEILVKKYRKSPLQLYIRLIQASTNPKLILNSTVKNQYAENNNDDFINEEATLPGFMNDLFKEEEIEFSIIEKELIQNVADKKTSKYMAGLQLVEKLVSEKKNVLVWCLFVDTIEEFYRDLKEKGIKAEIVYGQTSDEERIEIIKNFQKGEIEVLITNPHTLAESVSLHRVCHDAVYLEYSYNLTHMLQSRDRIHRLGLPENQYTQYYYFMMDTQDQVFNAIDYKIYERLKEKEERMLIAIEQDNLSVEPQMSVSDIVEIVGFFSN